MYNMEDIGLFEFQTNHSACISEAVSKSENNYKRYAHVKNLTKFKLLGLNYGIRFVLFFIKIKSN